MRQTVALIIILGGLLLASRPSSAASTLTFSGRWGGELADEARALAVDAEGNLYLTGMTQSTALPQSTEGIQHGVDAYVAKISADGEQVEYVYWFNAISAADVDESFGIALAPDGGPIVVGHTRSADFCALFGNVPGADTTYNGNSDAFAFKIKPDGSGLAYCTFLGGSDWDLASAVAVAPDGSAIVSGGTWSTDFPVSAEAPFATHSGQRDAFVAWLSPDGTQLTSATFLGGSKQEEGRAIALDKTGRTLIAGWTNSAELPTTPLAYQSTLDGAFDGFVAAFAPDGSLDFLTYLGTSGEDRLSSLALSAESLALGGTWVPADELATRGSVALLSLDGQTLQGHTMVGDATTAVAALNFDADGHLLVTGTSTATTLPISAEALQATHGGGSDAFVMRLSPHLQIDYSSFLGGARDERGLALAVRSGGDVVLAGATDSAKFPTTPNSFGTEPQGDFDLFVTALSLPPAPVTYRTYLPLARSAPSALQ